MVDADWLMTGLSSEQRSVLAHGGKACSVLASAGSGKTKTLVHLIASEVVAGASPAGIVAFTFTEKAAEELLARAHALIREHLPDLSLQGLFIGTIHAWCLQYLSQQSDFYNFTPIDELHLDSLASRLYDYLDIGGTYGIPYPRGIRRFLADVEVYYNEHIDSDHLPARVRPSIDKFITVLRQNRLLTFGAMVRYATEHLQENGVVPGLEALFVDEYQDVNPAQVALMKAMVSPESKVIVVGDDLQCIYNWRGSDVTRLIRFPNDFEGGIPHRLVNNYRSRPGIVQFGNASARMITLRDHLKDMKPVRPPTECANVHWLNLTSEEEQAATVVDIIERFSAQGVPWNKMAVLLRSVVRWGGPIAEALTVRGIPVQCPILGRGGRFINEFLLPLFNWLHIEHGDPKNESEEARLEELARELWGSLHQWISAAITESTFWQALDEWLVLIEGNRDEAYDIRGRLYDFLNTCQVHIAPSDHNLMAGIGIASQIIRSVEEIHRRRLVGQRRLSARGVTSEVYFTLSRKQQEYGESMPIDMQTEAVLVTTVHQAKGLEWPVVIIPMMSTGCFPVRSRKHDSSFPPEVIGRYGTSLEDERRLFYVAVTRARERLFLLDPTRLEHGRTSVFLREQEGGTITAAETLPEIGADVWQLDEDELKDSDPPPIRIGLSDLSIYVECPYQFGLRRMVQVQPSIGGELGYGMGLHELIQRRFDADRPWNLDELGRQVTRHVHLPYMSEQGEETARQAIRSSLGKLEDIGVFAAKAETEIDIEVVLDTSIIHGVVDCVIVNEDGTISIWDWKSNIHQSFLPRYERQVRFYAHALRLGGRCIANAKIVDVGQSTRQGHIVASEVDVSESKVAGLIELFRDALHGIAAGRFPALPDTHSCNCCDIYRICSERRGE